MNDQSNILSTLQGFVFERVLSQDASHPSIYLLGSIDSQPALIHLEKLNFDAAKLTASAGKGKDKVLAADETNGGLSIGKAEFIEQNDVYTWAVGWFSETRPADVKLSVICPCTDVHIRKHSDQKRYMFVETPETYEKVVKPYIDSFPPSRTQWVANILEGKKEQENILYEEKGEEGFVVMPDLKWDRKNLQTLYLQTIVHTRSIECMRDLEPKHIPLLRKIKAAADKVCKEQFGLEENMTRVFVHYHPSYYHFHVHIVSIENEAHHGTRVGKAHMLDDLISLLEISARLSPEQSLIKQMTYSYVLGEQDGLYAKLKEAGLVGA